MTTLARFARPEDEALFQSRRAFNEGAEAWQAWFDAHKDGHPDAAVWGRFEELCGASFAAQGEELWRFGVHPLQRAALGRMFCGVARAKMELDPAGDPRPDGWEARLWSAALASSPRSASLWEAEQLARSGELGFGFASVLHRLADLYRRAARFDGRAIRLYAQVFVGPNPHAPSRWGNGEAHSLPTLLERGAAITPTTPPAEVPARHTLCLLLSNRGWPAPWVARSVHIARQSAAPSGQPDPS